MTSKEQKPVTYQEAIATLEKNYNTKVKAVSDLKDQLLTAQDDVFKALRDLATVKEEFLRAVIEQAQKSKDSKDSKEEKSSDP